MPEPIPADDFLGTDTVALARTLVGRVLVRARDDGLITRHRITETEAYCGESDLACHASKGRTRRTEVLYARGGVWYVYLCYGIHEMLNLVTGPKDHAAAVLIRGIVDVNGPGRLTRHLNIDRRLNAQPAAVESGLWLEDDGFRPSRSQLKATPRIGVDYAGPLWAGKKWRFVWTPPLPEGGVAPASRQASVRAPN